MGRLVQQPPATRADRQHPAGRGRSQLLRRSGGAGTRRLTQTKRPPRKSGRFTSFNSLSQLKAHIDTFITTYNDTARPFEWTASEVHQKRLKPRIALQ